MASGDTARIRVGDETRPKPRIAGPIDLVESRRPQGNLLYRVIRFICSALRSRKDRIIAHEDALREESTADEAHRWCARNPLHPNGACRPRTPNGLPTDRIEFHRLGCLSQVSRRRSHAGGRVPSTLGYDRGLGTLPQGWEAEYHCSRRFYAPAAVHSELNPSPVGEQYGQEGAR